MIEFEGTRGGDDGHKGEAYDESDDDDIAGSGGPRVGCAQQ